MALTDAACRNASCPVEKKRVRLTDGAGLYLEVAPNRSRRFFFKYVFGGKEKRLALGGYPEVGLKAAREARDEARSLLRAGTDPVQRRKIGKLAQRASSAITFEAVAREFHAAQLKGQAWGATHAAQWLRGVEKDAFPWIGALPLAQIAAPVLLQVLRRIEARGAINTAHDVRQYAGQVFRYGIATGRCERDSATELRGALTPHVVEHMSAVLEPAAAGKLMADMETYQGQPTTRAALVLSALLFQRPGNIRSMEWSELDLDAAMWRIESKKMKGSVARKLNGRPHLIPLAPQAVAILRDLHPLTGHGSYVFRSVLTGERPMSENTIRNALRRMGYGNDEMTAHGFRAMARTLMAERLPGIGQDVVEAQLAHGKSGPLGSAYDRADYMEQRRKMMATWANYLDELRLGASAVALKVA